MEMAAPDPEFDEIVEPMKGAVAAAIAEADDRNRWPQREK